MKRHILGLGIFSLIVGATVLIWSAFFVKYQFDYSRFKVDEKYPAKKTSCFSRRRTSEKVSPSDLRMANLSVKQAVLDLNTKQLDWEMTVPQNNSAFALHFFVKDNSGTRYIASELGPLPMKNISDETVNTGNFEFTSSYLWLDNLKSYQNLYVVPEQLTLSDYRSKNFTPTFNEETATSVLLYSGKNDYLTERFLKK